MAGRSTARLAASRGARSLALALVCMALGAQLACSRGETDVPATEPPLEEDPQATALVRHHDFDAGPPDAAPPSASSDALDAATGPDTSDGRAEREQAILAAAAKLCGSEFLPDCPLQGWMKQHAKPLFMFGDISSIGEAFDEIALFLPPDELPDGGPYYVNWVSIAKDGARTARMGNLNAAKAACRGCHSQYRATYHSAERARPLPEPRGSRDAGAPLSKAP